MMFLWINDDEVPVSRNDLMPIEITIIKSPSTVNVAQTSHTFPDAGGTLGRGSDNLWALDDPNKYMSTVHAKIACVAQQYFLTDLSTNGTFINGSAEPIGNGNQVSLNDGDIFSISDYEFIAKIASGTVSDNLFQDSNNSDPFADFDAPLPEDDFISQAQSNNDPFSSGIHQTGSENSSLPAFDMEQTDPLALLDNAQAASDPFAQPIEGLDTFSNTNPANEGIPNNFTAATSTTIDKNSAATDSISWPKANQEAGLIPDDWDDDDLLDDFNPNIASTASAFAQPQSAAQPQQALNQAQPASQVQSVSQAQAVEAFHQPALQTSAPQTSVPQVEEQYSNEKYIALELQNQQLKLEVMQLKQQLAQANSAQVSANISNQPQGETQSVVNAMGLAKWNLDDKKVAQINDTVGLLMRETMQGMMRVLKFRKKIKEEFRINVTTIQSIENNPLKFSANIDDAMENMFIKENNAYKAPVDAFKEGFQGIAEHQVAVIAGMQAAFRGMIERFDPNNLESRFEKYKSTSLLNLGQKSKRWNAYKQYHQGLIENLDDSFQHLFGYDFVQAYEDQMQRLISARLKLNDNDEEQPTN
jgi:type VI secretion system FHA domain protein